MANLGRITKPHSGFTLVEVLVSLIIFVILSAIAYGGLTSVLRSRERVEANLAELRQLQSAFLELERDLTQVLLRFVRDEYGEKLLPLKGSGAGGAFLEFTRGGLPNPAHLARSTLQRVAFEYSGERLTRVFWRVLDRAQDTKPMRKPLLKGVRHLGIRFFDEGGTVYEQWPPENQTEEEAYRLPQAVEFSVAVEGLGEFKRLFRVARGQAAP